MNVMPWLLLVLVLCLVGAVGPAVGAQGVENTSVPLQSPESVTIDSEIQTDGSEAELLVGVADDSVAIAESMSTETTVSQLQTNADAAQAPFRQFATETQGVTVENRFWLTNAMLVRVDTDRVALDSLARIKGVESIDRNHWVGPIGGPIANSSTKASNATPAAGSETVSPGSATPNSHGSTTYGLDQIDAPGAWSAYDTQGEGTSVAVLDTGVDPSHPDIDLAGWTEFDRAGNEIPSEPYSCGIHGTHVSGIVSGGSASGEHIGVAPETDLYHVGVFTDIRDGRCGGNVIQVLAGMEWAVANDVDVLSMSLGSSGYSFNYIDAVRQAENAGTTVVASIGNDGSGTSGSPGNLYDTISVGASDQNMDIASFSGGELINTTTTWGASAPAEWPNEYFVPSVAAPGVSIKSAVPGGGYEFKQGTSGAAPHVSGAIALMESVANDSPTSDEIKNALESTASKPTDAPSPPGSRDRRYGSGIINVTAAVDALVEFPPNFEINSLTPANVTVKNNSDFNVSANLKNTGDIETTQQITLTINDFSKTQNETLDSGENNTVTFANVNPGQFGPGEYTYEIASENDSASGNLTVQAPANFQMSNLQPQNTSVPSDSAIDISVDVQNTGGVGTQNITLSIGGFHDSREITIPRDASSTVTFSNVDTGQFGPGEYTYEIASENDLASGNLTVRGFQVSNLQQSDQSVASGTEIDISAELKNIGDVQATQNIQLKIEPRSWMCLGNPLMDCGTLHQTQTVTLAGGATTTVTFANIDTSPLSNPGGGDSHRIRISSNDDSTSSNLNIESWRQPKPANFSINIDSDSPVTKGDTLTVNATIKNTGDVGGKQTVEFDARMFGQKSVSLSLNRSELATETFKIETDNADAGSYPVTVSSENDNESTSIVVQDSSPQPPVLEDPSNVSETNIVDTTVTGGLNLGPSAASNVDSTSVNGLTILDDYPQNGASIFEPIVGSVYAVDPNLDVTGALDERYGPVAVGQHTGLANLPVQTDTYEDAKDLLNFQQEQGNSNKPEQQVIVTFELDGDAEAETQTITVDFAKPADAGLKINTTMSSVRVLGNGANTVTETSINGSTNEITATIETNSDTDAQVVTDIVYEAADPVEGLNIDGGINDLAVVGEGPHGDTERDRFLAAEVGATAVSHADVDRTANSTNDGFIGEPVDNETGAEVNLSSLNDADGERNPGAFLVWQNQTVTFETASPGNTLEIFEAVQLDTSGELVHAKGERVMALGTAPGQVVNLDTSRLDPGQYFVDFQSSGDNSAVVLDVRTLGLSASVSDLATRTQDAEIDVRTNDITGGNVEAWILEAGTNEVKDVLHVEQDSLLGTGDRTVSVDVDTELENGGKYYAVVRHTESEITTQTGTFEVPPPPVVDNPPEDIDDDGLYEDIDGSGEFNIFDVQALFSNVEKPIVQDNAQFFNFQGADDTEVRIFDVQGLFGELSS